LALTVRSIGNNFNQVFLFNGSWVGKAISTL
jgi:hypothetical protein